MEIVEVRTCVYTDTSVEDGYIWVQPCASWAKANHVDFFMSPATHDALSGNDLFASIFAELRQRGPGLHLIPPALLRREEAEEVQRGLALVEPEPSSHCAFPPCILPTVAVHPDGFSLCAEHASLLQGWDDLVA